MPNQIVSPGAKMKLAAVTRAAAPPTIPSRRQKAGRLSCWRWASAGKSTLLKILSGAHSADSGTIELFGAPVAFATPHDAQRAGIVTIYQEFTLAPDMTIAENVFIGREPGSRLFVSWRRLADDTRAITDRIGLKRDPMTPVRDLSVAEQQLVEIARALSMRSRLIVMDEPTSALSEAEVANLVRIIRRLKAEGLSIIFVTHRLGGVFRLLAPS